MNKIYLFPVACIFLLWGCAVTGTSSKYNLSSGFYYSKLNNNRNRKYYLVANGDSIKVYPGNIKRQLSDTVKSLTLLFPPQGKPSSFINCSFISTGLDLDVITILFKYRPSLKQFPGQLNSTFNGAFYTGYRVDRYSLSYEENPLHIAIRKVKHLGYSLGAFAGIGTARIDEYVTLNRIDYEYDGAVFTTGLASELAVNKLNFGIECGLDFLTDKNSHVWVNEHKPWIGISLGLNIN